LNAPSSAHRKLQEALLWLNEEFRPTDLVWDAGAAAGGWSYEALKQGAKVFAVDRGQMDPLLMENGQLEHVRKDAFTAQPTEPITFLICDIIELPPRVLAWLKDFIATQPLRAFVVTFKLKKPLDFNTLDDAARWARETLPTWEWRIKNLRNNKLEVTFMARCSEVK
jgi:23S rRNA (cytidine2498-2'-O)-methyltransferase